MLYRVSSTVAIEEDADGVETRTVQTGGVKLAVLLLESHILGKECVSSML